MRPILCLVALALLSSNAQAAEKPKLRVAVIGAESNGFIDSGVADSIVDLKKALSKKVFEVVEPADSHELTIVITGRHTGSEIVGSQTSIRRGIFGGLYASNTPIVARWSYVFAQVQVGTHTQELYGFAHFWSMASTILARSIEKWTKTNAAQIARSANRGGS